MEIKDNILKGYLKNVRFVTGTAYAGKSTMCGLLAERFGLIHCEENYGLDQFLALADPEHQPNLCYFKTMGSWQEFLSRTPEEYYDWIIGNQYEVAGFEIAELIRKSQNQIVIADTNIPLEYLHRITDYHQVAVMLSPQSMSVERFFDRSDPEKQFLLEQIRLSPNPEKTLENFKACIRRINSQQVYEEYAQSGFFTLVRTDDKKDTREEILLALAEHFRLENIIK